MNLYQKMSENELCNVALQIQDACNSVGLVNSMAEIMMSDFFHKMDTSEKNNHPIVVLFIYKLAALAGMEVSLMDDQVAMKSFEYCNEKGVNKGYFKCKCGMSHTWLEATIDNRLTCPECKRSYRMEEAR